MKIAILAGLKMHFECIPFILEAFYDRHTSHEFSLTGIPGVDSFLSQIYIFFNGPNSFQIDIFTKKGLDKYGWIDFCLWNYRNDAKHVLNVKYDEFSPLILCKYDKIIKISSQDPSLCHERILSILHVNRPENFDGKTKRFITLTPYIRSPRCTYMFPVFDCRHDLFRNTPAPSLPPIVVFVGYCLDEHIDQDTDNFIMNNNDHLFFFIVWGNEESGYRNLHKHSNTRVFTGGMSTFMLCRILSMSRFVLSRKYINYDRFSGVLMLAMSFEKPLIIDNRTKVSYDLPGFGFSERYCELNRLGMISEKQYRYVVNQAREWKENKIANNRVRWRAL